MADASLAYKDERPFGIVYCITNNVTGKRYVGLTTQTINARWAVHTSDARREKGCRFIGRAIRKYGVEAFVVEQIDVATDDAELQAKEREWITRLNTRAPNGYNLTGGGGANTDWTDEARAAASAAQLARFAAGPQANPMFGRRQSESTKTLIGEKARARMANEQSRADRSTKMKAFYERHPEAVAAISEARRGKPTPHLRSAEANAKRTAVTSSDDWKRRRAEAIRAGIAAAMARKAALGLPRAIQRPDRKTTRGVRYSPERCAAISARQKGVKRGPRQPKGVSNGT